MASIEDVEYSPPNNISSECQVSVADDPTSTGSTCTQTCDAGHERLITKKTVSNGVQHCRASNPPNYLWFAVIVSLCNCPFGVLGVGFSLLSRSSLRKRHYKDARKRGNIAKWLSIVGIAVSFVAMAFLLLYFLCIDKRIVDTLSELRKEIENDV